MAIGAGPMYENETWNYKGIDTLKQKVKDLSALVYTNGIKFNSYFKLEVLPTDAHHFSFVLFYQAWPSTFFQARLATKFAYDIKLTKHFNFSFMFNSLYDAKPVVPIPKFYYNFSNGITYSF